MASRTPSARVREEQAAASRQGLLETGRSSPQSSNDQLSKALADEEGDAARPNAGNDQTIELSNRKTKRKQSRSAKGSPSKSSKRFCRPTKWCLFITAIVIVVVFASLGGLGTFVLKNSPKDGLSPPWYPTPRGGTVGSWEESYKKAHAMVEKMSLVEKVNVTTGVGWSMGMCVGNTGESHLPLFTSIMLTSLSFSPRQFSQVPIPLPPRWTSRRPIHPEHHCLSCWNNNGCYMESRADVPKRACTWHGISSERRQCYTRPRYGTVRSDASWRKKLGRLRS
jgi:hypothetical protein